LNKIKLAYLLSGLGLLQIVVSFRDCP